MDLSDTGRTIHLCGKCGRVGYAGSEEVKQWWLVSSPPLAERYIARCPRHVTEWAMRVAGVPRNKTFRRWLRQAHEWDAAQPERVIPEIAHPYPFEGPFEKEEDDADAH